jgi:hypothetical protein
MPSHRGAPRGASLASFCHETPIALWLKGLGMVERWWRSSGGKAIGRRIREFCS